MTELDKTVSGYAQAVANMDLHIEQAITRHNGVKTLQDAIKVLNDIIAYIHNERMMIAEAILDRELEKPEDIDALLDELAQPEETRTLHVIKGGIE